ncbi:hypothetical protein NHL50_04510 [Acidimicrobiia bacterium EGI L10123]|uniref:hypothetical protein n=1 Tax=Salinilacustrithrix flava TaxID=2957203 RepID=UPI003D7C1AFD|nr:hypothetical protein [Acidimicrobiia bacterium EGI L10123]
MNVRRRTTRALVAWAVGAAIMRLTLWAPEVCPPIARSEARLAATQAADWIVRNQTDDGEFLYDFHRGRDESSDDYNLVRHAGVTMSLYQLVRGGEVQYLDAADRGVQWMTERLQPTGGGGRAFTDVRRAKLGASSLLVVSLAQRRLATSDTQHDQLMRDLGTFLVEQQRADGSMLNFHDIETGEPVPDQTSVFATGEALWALALLHEAFPQLGFDEPAWRTLDYMATSRDLDEDIFPQPWPDQWAAYSLGEMGDWGLADAHIDYARRLIERFAMIIRFDAQRGSTYGSITHGPAPRGGGVGTWLEGLGALRTLTVTDERLADLEDPLEETLACAAGVLAERQVEPGEDVSAREAGAWFYDDLTRMDDQQHAASGLLLSLPVLP